MENVFFPEKKVCGGFETLPQKKITNLLQFRHFYFCCVKIQDKM